jgi:hypothetical protein
MVEEHRTADGRVVEVQRSSNMGWLIALVVIVGIVVLAFALGFINIDQTKSAKLPNVNVQTSGGQAPSFDVNTAEINVGSKKATIDVPTVGTKEETIDVPTVGMKPAGNPDAKN